MCLFPSINGNWFELFLQKLRGRAEPIRLLLAECGQKYEDDRIELSDWPSIKPTTQFGQVKN